MATVNTTQFFTQLVETARKDLAHPVPGVTGYTARNAAQDALDEAHSALSQPQFFAALDALGGQQAALNLVEEALLKGETAMATRSEKKYSIG